MISVPIGAVEQRTHNTSDKRERKKGIAITRQFGYTVRFNYLCDTFLKLFTIIVRNDG